MLTPTHLSFEAYQAIDAVNISALIEIATSPKQYCYRLSHPRQDAASYRLGRGAHTGILEPLRFLRDYALSPYADFREKEAQEWRAAQEAARKTVLTEAQFQAVERMRLAVHRHPVARRYLADGEPEVTIQWIDGDADLRAANLRAVACKGRIDWLAPGAIVDLKTTRHPRPDAFGRDAARLHYHTRMSWYRDGARAALGLLLPVVLIAVQVDEPHDVAVYRMTDEQLDAGRRCYEGLLETLRACRAADHWPGVCEDDAIDLPMPAWSLRQPEDDELELTFDGQPMSF